MTTLTDQTVLITGANRGLGREFVEQFLTRGVAKVYAAARNPESITTDDPRVVPLQLDVTDPDSVARAAATAHDVSIVVNNAGVSTPTRVLSGDTANLRRELEVNLFGPLAVTTAFADRLADRRGAVVNVASVLSWLGIGGSYSVSKAALWSATDSMRLDLTPRGVQVVGVYMAYVDTDMATGSTRRKPRPPTSSDRSWTVSKPAPSRSSPIRLPATCAPRSTARSTSATHRSQPRAERGRTHDTTGRPYRPCHTAGATMATILFHMGCVSVAVGEFRRSKHSL